MKTDGVPRSAVVLFLRGRLYGPVLPDMIVYTRLNVR